MLMFILYGSQIVNISCWAEFISDRENLFRYVLLLNNIVSWRQRTVLIPGQERNLIELYESLFISTVFDLKCFLPMAVIYF